MAPSAWPPRAASVASRVLPMPGSPASSTSLALAVLRFRPRRGQHFLLRVAAEHCERPQSSRDAAAAARRRRERFPLHCKGRDGLGQSLERQLAERGERVAAATAGQHADDVGDDDLSAGRDGAEPRGLDHGRTIASPSSRVASPEEMPMRICTGSRPAPRPAPLVACCMATAQAMALAALSKRSIRPSPVVFTSLPLCFAIGAAQRGEVRVAQRLVGSCPRRLASSVEPTRSVKRIVAVPVGDAAGAGHRLVASPFASARSHPQRAGGRYSANHGYAGEGERHSSTLEGSRPT